MYKKYKKRPNKSAYLLKTVIFLRGKYVMIYAKCAKWSCYRSRQPLCWVGNAIYRMAFFLLSG